MSSNPPVIIVNAFQRDVLYGRLHFAPARRAGKDARIVEPHPAWTAIGVEGSFLDEGHVEIKVTAHIPKS